MLCDYYIHAYFRKFICFSASFCPKEHNESRQKKNIPENGFYRNHRPYLNDIRCFRCYIVLCTFTNILAFRIRIHIYIIILYKYSGAGRFLTATKCFMMLKREAGLFDLVPFLYAFAYIWFLHFSYHTDPFSLWHSRLIDHPLFPPLTPLRIPPSI